MDRPILFSGPMVRALLDGRKTQTRRVLSSDKPNSLFNGQWADSYVLDPGNQSWRDREVRYAVGERLWVREAWRCNGWASDVATIFYRASEADGYTAMCEQHPIADKKPLRVTGTWRPGIHMPRWASRITLTVTDVRVQKLLDISEEDARAEGFADGPLGDPIPETDIGGGWTVSSPGGWASAAGHFQVYWSQLHPDWDGFSSPWVVAITFTVERRNIDEAA